jgi:flavorubredoxin
MKAVVVYESLWGNTAAIAKAIAEGIGPGARALSTAEATADVVADADLIVAGAPLLGFNLPTEEMRQSIAANPTNPKPDLAHPSMRAWLDGLPKGLGHGAGFETRIWWSPGSAAKQIAVKLQSAGYSAGTSEKFLVIGRYGPLKDGEIERARAWGAKLAQEAS